jgi:S1-C subfamily serine protease
LFLNFLHSLENNVAPQGHFYFLIPFSRKKIMSLAERSNIFYHLPMQDLNKSQLILLTLLVSFVTSIGTGIITTSLLQEAPASVTQVINRVVERTIEQVTPDTPKTSTVKPRETQVTTVVVKEEDQVIEAISKNEKSIIRIQDTSALSGNQFYGIGLLLTKEGLVVSARRASSNPSSAAPATFSAIFPDGTTHQITKLGTSDDEGLTFFKIVKAANQTISAVPAIISTGSVQLGQSAISISGEEKNAVSIGRIVSIDQNSQNSKEIKTINTDISGNPKIFGAPALNLSGEIIGLRVVLEGANQSFISNAVLLRVMKEYVGR